MSEHDPLCPASLPQVCQCALCDPYCVCDIIESVRADERAKQPPLNLTFRRPLTQKQVARIVAAIAAARGGSL